MYKTPSLEEILASYTNNGKSFKEAATDLGAIIQEIEHEKNTTENTRKN